MARVACRAWITGGILGVLAYAVGFVATHAIEDGRPGDDETFVTGDPQRESGGYTVAEVRDLGGSESLPTAVEFTGWLHHRAHSAALQGTFRLRRGDQVPAEVHLDPQPITYVVPVLVLLIAGYWVSARFPAENAVIAAARGSYVAIGYVVPAIATVFLLEWTFTAAEGTLVIRPDPGTAIAMTGIIYPVLFGGIGGYLAQEIHGEGTIGEQFQ